MSLANKRKRITYPTDYVWRVVLIAGGWKHTRWTHLPPLASYGAAHLSVTVGVATEHRWTLLMTISADLGKEKLGQQKGKKEKKRKTEREKFWIVSLGLVHKQIRVRWKWQQVWRERASKRATSDLHVPNITPKGSIMWSAYQPPLSLGHPNRPRGLPSQTPWGTHFTSLPILPLMLHHHMKIHKYIK